MGEPNGDDICVWANDPGPARSSRRATQAMCLLEKVAAVDDDDWTRPAGPWGPPLSTQAEKVLFLIGCLIVLGILAVCVAASGPGPSAGRESQPSLAQFANNMAN